MGGLSGLFGLGGGGGGTSFAAPSLAPIQTPINSDQVQQSYNQNLTSLQQQQNLLAALQGAGGIQNQSNVYNQLQGVVSGQGPNPAQAMLNQSTGQNVANQAALMAGQRGSNANVGLIGRQIAQQGAATQQQAAGQAATLQAQQSLNALQQAGSIANTQVANQIGATNANTSANQAQFANLNNAIAAQNNAQVANQGSVNAANATLGGAQLKGQQGMFGGLLNSAGAGISALGGSGKTDPASTGNEGTANPMGTSSNSAYAPGSSAPGPYAPQEAHGGMIKGYDMGGTVTPQPQQQPQGPVSSFGQFVAGVKEPAPLSVAEPQQDTDSGGGGLGLGGIGNGLMSVVGGAIGGAYNKMKSSSAPDNPQGTGVGSGDTRGGGDVENHSPDAPSGGAPTSSGYLTPGNSGDIPPAVFQNSAHGGMVDVVLSPGEKVVPPGKVQKAAGGKVEGKTVPGKARVAGDSYANDTYKTKLPPGSIVVPRSRINDAGAFVRETLAKRGRK